MVDEADTLSNGHIRPVLALGVVQVIGLEQIVEDLLLGLGHVGAILLFMIRNVMPMWRIGLCEQSVCKLDEI